MTKILMKEIAEDLDLKEYTLEKNLPLLKKLKEEYRKTRPAVCIERAKYITEYMKSSDGQDEPMELRRARAINFYLTKRAAIFHDDNLIAGASTSKPLGAPVFPELLTGLSIWPELDTIGTRKENPLQLSEEDAEHLNLNIFPYWMERSILEATRKKLTEEKSSVLEAVRLQDRLAFFIAAKAGCISHTTPFYENVLEKGLNAMINEARQKEQTLDNTQPDKREFYRAQQIAMQGIINYANNLAEKASELAVQAQSAQEKKYFREMADICARVPVNPAETFREAINSLWLCHVGVLGENINMAMNPGRLDQVLYPYFKKDATGNKITAAEALTLIGCLWFKIADNTNLVPETSEKMFGGAGSVPAVTLGGIDKKGKDAVNDLTYLMLRVTELLKIKDPNMNARYHAEINKQEYLDRVSRVIINTGVIPAIYNDITNIATLKNQGVKNEHARDYAVIGCVELGSAGREYSASSSIILNLTAAIDMTLSEGKRPYITGEKYQIGPLIKLEELKTFPDFYNAFESQLKTLVEKAIAFNEELGKMHQKLLPSPLLSCFFEGPREKGRDLIFGGALYNSSGATHVGFADACDSLNAIEDAVYLKKIVTLHEMKEAVEKNFAGYDRLYAYLRTKVPRYGMDDSGEKPSIAVKNSKRLITFLYNLYQGHTNYRGGKYRPAYWTMTNHAGLGTIGQALPSGRKQGEVFSSGITPAPQCARDLTGAYLSAAKLNSKYIPGGYALNMKYSPPTGADEDYAAYFSRMAVAYFKAGGMQVQYNIRDYQDFINARQDPDSYRDLIVRVSGYSAYFTDLNPYMQHELITRTQYDLKTGKAVPLTVTIPDIKGGTGKDEAEGGEE